MKTFALSNMEDTAVESHASGNKPQTSLKKALGTNLVSEFCKRKDAKPEKSSPDQREELSTSLPSSSTELETS